MALRDTSNITWSTIDLLLALILILLLTLDTKPPNIPSFIVTELSKHTGKALDLSNNDDPILDLFIPWQGTINTPGLFITGLSPISRLCRLKDSSTIYYSQEHDPKPIPINNPTESAQLTDLKLSDPYEEHTDEYTQYIASIKELSPTGTTSSELKVSDLPVCIRTVKDRVLTPWEYINILIEGLARNVPAFAASYNNGNNSKDIQNVRVACKRASKGQACTDKLVKIIIGGHVDRYLAEGSAIENQKFNELLATLRATNLQRLILQRKELHSLVDFTLPSKFIVVNSKSTLTYGNLFSAVSFGCRAPIKNIGDTVDFIQPEDSTDLCPSNGRKVEKDTAKNDYDENQNRRIELRFFAMPVDNK